MAIPNPDGGVDRFVPPPNRNNQEKLQRVGMYMRRLRAANGNMNMRDVENVTAGRFGERERVYQTQQSRIEHGSLQRPPLEDLLKLAYVHHVDVETLLEWLDIPFWRPDVESHRARAIAEGRLGG